MNRAAGLAVWPPQLECSNVPEQKMRIEDSFNKKDIHKGLYEIKKRERKKEERERRKGSRTRECCALKICNQENHSKD